MNIFHSFFFYPHSCFVSELNLEVHIVFSYSISIVFLVYDIYLVSRTKDFEEF